MDLRYLVFVSHDREDCADNLGTDDNPVPEITLDRWAWGNAIDDQHPLANMTRFTPDCRDRCRTSFRHSLQHGAYD